MDKSEWTFDNKAKVTNIRFNDGHAYIRVEYPDGSWGSSNPSIIPVGCKIICDEIPLDANTTPTTCSFVNYMWIAIVTILLLIIAFLMKSKRGSR